MEHEESMRKTIGVTAKRRPVGGFWAASLLRGPRLLRLTKVQGHTTLRDLADGKIIEANREGGDKADVAADAGTNERMPGLLQLTKWMAMRHNLYCRFMTRVHRVIVETMNVEKKTQNCNAQGRKG